MADTGGPDSVRLAIQILRGEVGSDLLLKLFGYSNMNLVLMSLTHD